MIDIILYTSLLALVHIMLPNLVKSRFGEATSERARKAAHNFAESLPVFFVLAILSIHLNVESNETLALIWLCLRLVFVSLYVSGIGTKPANEKGYEAQPLRSIVWIISIGYLVKMAINLT
jgi:uncharacterized MAPEG superfamily protein